MTLQWTEQLASIRDDGRADPPFFDPRVKSVEFALRDQGAVRLADLVDGAWRGFGPEYSEFGTVRAIKSANVQRFEISHQPAQFVSTEFAEAHPRALIPQGALMITSTGVGSAGRCFLKLDDGLAVADGHVTIVPTRSRVVGAYLCAYFQSPAGIQQLISRHRGSSRQIEIYPEDILELLVPAVGPKAQESIGSRWLEAVESIEGSNRAHYEAEKRILAYVGWDRPVVNKPAAVMWSEAITGRRTRRLDPEFNSPDVQELRQALEAVDAIPLSAAIRSFRKGIQPERYAGDGSIGVIKSKDVRFPDINLAACERTDLADCEGGFLEGGEVLLNSTGEGTLGRAGVVPTLDAEARKFIAAVDVYVVEVDREIVLPEYLALYLNSAIGRTLTNSLRTGSSGQQHLYPSHLDAIPLAFPKLKSGRADRKWQKETVSIVERRRLALERARAMGNQLDREFVELIGVPVDLSILPT